MKVKQQYVKGFSAGAQTPLPASGFAAAPRPAAQQPPPRPAVVPASHPTLQAAQQFQQQVVTQQSQRFAPAAYAVKDEPKWRPPPRREQATLRFTPYAWAKLGYMCDAGQVEVSMMGLADPQDPLLVTDLMMLPQRDSWAGTEFLDGEFTKYIDTMAFDRNIGVNHCARIWIHTHPGDCPTPSGTDERTFQEVFGGMPWAVMAIMARGRQTYSRIQYGGQGVPFTSRQLEWGVEYDCDFPGTDKVAWKAEYDRCVNPPEAQAAEEPRGRAALLETLDSRDAWYEDDDYYYSSNMRQKRRKRPLANAAPTYDELYAQQCKLERDANERYGLTDDADAKERAWRASEQGTSIE